MDIKNIIWYEKYRPKSITNMILNPSIRSKFYSFIKDKDFPHLLLSGPPGTGKTTLSYILINSIPSVNIELNASSRERGIDIIKNDVYKFASSMPRKGKIKIVFMDEADGLTPEAQRALKNTIEKFSNHCKFILTANNHFKIIPEIKSRLQHITFDRGVFTKEKCVDFISDILDNENIEYRHKDVVSIVGSFFPDIRKIVNYIQLNSIDGKLKKNNIKTEDISKIIRKGSFEDIKNFAFEQNDFSDLYRYLIDSFIYNYIHGEYVRREIALIIAKYVFQDSMVLDKAINFIGCCIEIQQKIGKNVDSYKVENLSLSNNIKKGK